MREIIGKGIAASLNAKLVAELLEAYEEAKRNFYLGGRRLSAVAGGRFCEAAFRLLQEASAGAITPLGRQLNTDQLIARLASLPASSHPDSIRLHIPRALRVVYDVRNNRDAAHLADGIDPNLQDATLVVSVLDWVLAEFVRLYHNVPPDEAHRMVDQLVTRTAPVVEDFDGFLKVLRPLPASEHCLVVLYQRGAEGATFEELHGWAPKTMRGNLRRTLEQLTDGKRFVHFDGARYKITGAGRQEVESRRLIEPEPDVGTGRRAKRS